MKRALLFHGGWDGHEPKACAEYIAGELRAHHVDVTLSDSLHVLDDRKALASFDLIIPLWTMGEITRDQERNLVETVRAGTGLGGFHGGMGDAFRGALEYQWMVGGQFVAHPDNIRDYVVRITEPNDPIVAGLGDFKVHTEQYYMLVDPANRVLAATTCSAESAPWISGVEMPVVWTKRHGEGRIFYSALGHRCHEFADVPAQRELTLRGLLWAAR